MNIIGDVGYFLFQYQNQIETFLIILAVVAAVFLIIRVFLGERKKRRLLSRLNDTVSEINTAVKDMNSKKSDVIYIDNRVSEPPSKTCFAAEDVCRQQTESDRAATSEQPAPAAVADEKDAADENAPAHAAISSAGAEPQDETEAEVETAAEAAAETETVAAAEAAAGETAESPAEEIEIPRKYSGIDCGISKTGRTYTIEELERQIKE